MPLRLSEIRHGGASSKCSLNGNSRREKSPDDRFTLFRLRFDPHLQRYPAPTDISTMQAMGRKKGPYCGPAFAQ